MGAFDQKEFQCLLDAADLTGAREFLVRSIQQADTPLARWLLLELNAMRGAWEGAQAQAAALTVMDPVRAGIYELYGRLAAVMGYREAVWRGEQVPRCLHGAWLVWEQRSKLLMRMQAGEKEVMPALRDLDESPALKLRGQLDNRAFTGCTDRDVRFKFGIEAVVGGEYCWFRWNEIQRVQLAGPGRQLRDWVWRPVMLTLRDGRTQQAFLPVRYPGTETATEPLVLLGRETLFQRQGDVEMGRGTRVFHCQFEGDDRAVDVPVLAFRALDLTPPAAV